MTIIRHKLKTPRWAMLLVVAGLVLSVWGAGLSYATSGNTSLSIGLGALAVLFALGLADSLLSYVDITPDTLAYFSNFRGRVIHWADIRSVAWNAGCPVMVVLVTGEQVKLPPLGDSLKIANSIRARLKRSDIDVGKDGPVITEAREAALPIARQIVSGEIDSYDGAMKIWKQVLDEMKAPIPDDLWPFKSNASAIEDCLWNARDSGANHDILMAQSREEIMQAARWLVDQSRPQPTNQPKPMTSQSDAG